MPAMGTFGRMIVGILVRDVVLVIMSFPDELTLQRFALARL